MQVRSPQSSNMDTVYGTKKYFQSLGASDSDYYNRSSSNRAVVSTHFIYFFVYLFSFFFLFIFYFLVIFAQSLCMQIGSLGPVFFSFIL